MTNREIKELKQAIIGAELDLDGIEDEDEFNEAAEEINEMIAEYHNGRYEQYLRRGWVADREEYNAKYGVFKV